MKPRRLASDTIFPMSSSWKVLLCTINLSVARWVPQFYQFEAPYNPRLGLNDSLEGIWSVPTETDDLVLARLRKLDAIREMGVDPFPRRYDRTHLSNQIITDFDRLEGTSVRVAGRLVGAIRHMGKAGFAHILDNGGRIQIHFRKDTLGDEAFALYRLLDIGDFIGVEGTPFRTSTGETTIQASTLTFLAKAMRPLPEKWHGLTDIEKRFRQRYLDLITNDEVRE